MKLSTVVFILSTFILLECWITNAHLAIWTKSMFGQDRGNVNSNRAAQPLQDMRFDQWWWHGDMNDPPDEGEVFNLPANGKADLEISSNKAFTSLGTARPGLKPNPRDSPNPWLNENGWGNMHARQRQDVAGCALGIAYKSDPRQVKPEDFVIFSVVHDCPARQLQEFKIPDLPACPNNKCMCAWFWIHESSGGTDQMYMTPFVCTVTGKPSNRQIGKPHPPVKCDMDRSKCVKGAKAPMYWKNLEGNNMFEPGHFAPTYSSKYGYEDGAQNDIFV
ncbi:unnamed protein product [Didymodactylos carnosus]|uniref:Uncharacterized protein n=1 Tax=Didymodactylos carnosus TaxID=1234261 RepID=A0A814N1F6_9BILA|nr:unnamed protein product [Didymodactylos carnosus]CAF1084181.1 unnamed protein product [Didymodactylos carnosus]CAF3612633.1 unnamed protein product [Didymodactylos carnosus]CAF3849783.1 unnamed protein product [Didymodactylos carnosus]